MMKRMTILAGIYLLVLTVANSSGSAEQPDQPIQEIQKGSKMNIETIIAVVMTLFIGIVSIVVTWLLYKSSAKNQSRLQVFISRITGLFAASQRVGIEAAYENREIALGPGRDDITCPLDSERSSILPPFVSRFSTEKKLIVVGSSLLGLRMYVNHLPAILQARVKQGLETKFMLTHPCFSSLREEQESRYEGQIKHEIEETLRFLENCSIEKNDIRFYRGTPTCFLVITSEAMLVNPYPYQIEAYSSFCLEVRRLPQRRAGKIEYKGENLIIPAGIDARFEGQFRTLLETENEQQYDYSLDIGPDIYGQFYWYHYLLPWFSRKAVTYDDYTNTCCSKDDKCVCLQSGYSREDCKILENRKINEEIGGSCGSSSFDVNGESDAENP